MYSSLFSVYAKSFAYQPARGMRTVALRNYPRKLAGARKFGCLMVNLPADIAKELTDWCLEAIPDYWLGKGGREFTPHTTVLYGFRQDTPEQLVELEAVLRQAGPINLSLLGLSVFPEGDDGVPLKLDVGSLQLHDLNQRLRESFDVEVKFPDYVPHVTVAYLDPQFVDLALNLHCPLSSRELIVSEAVWSPAEEPKLTIPLRAPLLPLMGVKAAPAAQQNAPRANKDKLGRERCYDNDGKLIPCNHPDELDANDNDTKVDTQQRARLEDAELLTDQQKSEQQAEPQQDTSDPQFQAEWDKVVTKQLAEIEANNVGTHDFSPEEIAAEQNWHSEFIQWRWGLQMPGQEGSPGKFAITPADVGPAARFMSGLLNPALGGARYIAGLLDKWVGAGKAKNRADAAIGDELQQWFDKANPDAAINKPAAELVAAVLGPQAVPIAKEIAKASPYMETSAPTAEQRAAAGPVQGKPSKDANVRQRVEKAKQKAQAKQRTLDKMTPEERTAAAEQAKAKLRAKKAKQEERGAKQRATQEKQDARFAAIRGGLSEAEIERWWKMTPKERNEFLKKQETAGKLKAVSTKSWTSKSKDVIPGGLADGKPDSAFDPEQLAAGIQAELEHTSDPDIAKEIAKDHLLEDPHYYVKLRQMESKAMSAFNTLSGGALVKPPKFMGKTKLQRTNWLALKKTLSGQTKSQGAPCKQGETAAETGCVPASGGGGQKKPKARKPKQPTFGKPDASGQFHSLSSADVWQGEAYQHEYDETELSSVSDYTGFAYKHINGSLRGTWDGGHDASYREDVQKHIAALDAAIAKNQLPEKIVAYRGLKNFSLMAGATFRDAGFVSVTLDRSIAEEFGEVVEVEIPAGTSVLFASAATGGTEYELVLSRGSSFQVTPDGKRLVLSSEGKKSLPATEQNVQAVEENRFGWTQGDVEMVRGDQTSERLRQVSKAFSFYQRKGRWVTMPANGEGGGGTPVYLDDAGEIEKGPKGIVGKKPDELDSKKSKQEETELPADKKPEPESEVSTNDDPEMEDDREADEVLEDLGMDLSRQDQREINSLKKTEAIRKLSAVYKEVRDMKITDIKGRDSEVDDEAEPIRDPSSIDPIIVGYDGEIIDGHHRLAGFIKAKKKKIPVIIAEKEDLAAADEFGGLAGRGSWSEEMWIKWMTARSQLEPPSSTSDKLRQASKRFPFTQKRLLP